MMEHVSAIVSRALAEEGLYDPTPAEARRDLRKWAAGRKKYAPALGPVPWQAVAAEKLIEELERYEQANEGMVVTELEDWTL